MPIPVTSDVKLELDNNFTHPQLSIVDNVYRQDTAEFYFQTSEAGVLVAERAFRFGSWFRSDITTTKPSGTMLIWHTNFEGAGSIFTWDENTDPSVWYGNAHDEFEYLGSGLGVISDDTYTVYAGANYGESDLARRRRMWVLGYNVSNKA
tara:strand:- start:85 stop:534 length:450 start_codon:yes stop_codon:yes gene_type:complete